MEIEECETRLHACSHRKEKSYQSIALSYVWKSIMKQALRVLVTRRIESLAVRTFKMRSFRQVTRTFRVDRRKGARMVEGRNTTRMYPTSRRKTANPCLGAEGGGKGEGERVHETETPGKGICCHGP